MIRDLMFMLCVRAVSCEYFLYVCAKRDGSRQGARGPFRVSAVEMRRGTDAYALVGRTYLPTPLLARYTRAAAKTAPGDLQ